MHAEKVENERGDDQQGRNTLFIDGLLVAAAQILYGLWRVPSGSRYETDSSLTARQNLYDLVVPLLPFACITGMSSLSERMKPADNIGGNRDRGLSVENP